MKLGDLVGAHVGALTFLRQRATTRTVNVSCAALLLVLFVVSLNSLASFPDSFSDEGAYGEAGFSLVTTGTFTAYDVPDIPAFRLGDGIRPHIVGALFGYIGKELGYSLRTARTISFIAVWGAIFLWLPVTRSFGLPPFLGALLFASSERVFWASHVFRPEATLVLVNTVLVLVLVLARSAESHALYWVGRGILNGPLVLAHGNGLVSAVVNTMETLVGRRSRVWRVQVARIAAYGAGALLALGAFYLVQVGPIGGWRVFFDQLSSAQQYRPSGGLLGMVRGDIEYRWGKELTVVGASLGGKIMRNLWYVTILGGALWSALGGAGLPRRLAVMGFGTIAGYTFLVHDRVDMHIAEMIPLLCAPFLAWVGGAVHGRTRRRRIAEIAVTLAIVVGMGLCVHHGIKYRPQVYRSAPESTSVAIRSFVETRATHSQPLVRAVIGDENLWFWLRGVVPIVPTYRAKRMAACDGDVVVACDPRKLPWLERCSLEYADPANRFSAYCCTPNGVSGR